MARIENDNYPTDVGLARWAVKHAARMALYSDGDGRMLEPCCGDDAPFAQAAKEIGMTPFGFDIRDVSPPLWNEAAEDDGCCYSRIDVAKDDLMFVLPSAMNPREKFDFDVVATNPPFIIGERVVRKSLDMLKPHGAAVFLTKVAFLGTQERSKFFKQRPPAEVWILTARPSFTGDGKTEIAAEYAFLFWHGRHTDRLLESLGMRVTKLYWLDNKRMMTTGSAKRVRIEKGLKDAGVLDS